MTRKSQVTCECNAYEFPHRIGGGTCTGDQWCASFRIIDSSLCNSCNCFGSECEAATGQDSFKNGDCYEEELRSQNFHDKYGNLPKSAEEIFELEYARHYNE